MRGKGGLTHVAFVAHERRARNDLAGLALLMGQEVV